MKRTDHYQYRFVSTDSPSSEEDGKSHGLCVAVCAVGSVLLPRQRPTGTDPVVFIKMALIPH